MFNDKGYINTASQGRASRRLTPKRILAVILTFAMVFTILPSFSLTAGASELVFLSDPGLDAIIVGSFDELPDEIVNGYDAGELSQTDEPGADGIDPDITDPEETPAISEQGAEQAQTAPVTGAVTSVLSSTSVNVGALDELDEDILYQGYDARELIPPDMPILPDTLTGRDIDGNPITIYGVTWESNPEFDPGESAFYEFKPVLPDGYELAEGATAPVISVFIRPAGLLAVPTSDNVGRFDVAAWDWVGTAPDPAFAELVGVNNLQIKTGANITLTGTSNTGSQIIEIQNNATVTLDNLTISRTNTIITVVSNSNVKLNLTGDNALTYTGTSNAAFAALLITPSSNVTINGTGTLTATGNGASPGIGFPAMFDPNHLTVESGTLNAIGGGTGRGIVDTNNITVNGGTVTVTGVQTLPVGPH